MKGFCADVRTDQRSLGESTRDVRFGDFNLVPFLVSCAGINGRLVRQIWQKKAELPSVARAEIIEEMYLDIKVKCVFFCYSGWCGNCSTCHQSSILSIPILLIPNLLISATDTRAGFDSRELNTHPFRYRMK